MTRAKTLLSLTLLFTAATSQALMGKDPKDAWPPVTPEELALKDCPTDPGCAAMILDRDEMNDNIHTYWTERVRIKIFTEEGKDYANVEIPFTKSDQRVDEINARTVRPDGKVEEFDGQIFERIGVKGRNATHLVKAFTLPGVAAGSIIEYGYKIHWGNGQTLDNLSPWAWYYLSQVGTDTATEWDVQNELYTRRAHFAFRPIKAPLLWTWFGLPSGVQPQRNLDVIEMEVRNIPGLKKEEFMPPRSMLMGRVEFFYIFGIYNNMDTHSSQWYWEQEGKQHAEKVEKFIGRHKEIQSLVDGLVASGDSPEAKLRKIYERAQQVKNLSFERSKTEKEEQREKLKDNNNVGDVLKHGYGWGDEINELFVAMARAAGFDAYIVDVAQRDVRAFVPDLLNWNQLTANVVEVHVGSKSLFFDPATRYCPYGHLPWVETEARGIRLEKDRGVLAATPEPDVSSDLLDRQATLQLDEVGNLQGNLKVVYTGDPALNLRLRNRNQDETGRRKALEDAVKEWLPAGGTADLKNSPNWESSDDTFTAEFAVKIPGFATSTGRRLLLSPAVFQTTEKFPFQTIQRTYPVYFESPFRRTDDVTIQVPSGYSIESLPAKVTEATSFGMYKIEYGNQAGALHLARTFEMDHYFLPLSFYSPLRILYDKARAGDGQQAVLKIEQTASSK